MLDQWMAEFHYLLTYNNPALAENDPEKESVVDAVKAAVCDNIYLFIQINEDEFEKYLKTFAQDVWTELTKVSLNPGQVTCLLRNVTPWPPPCMLVHSNKPEAMVCTGTLPCLSYHRPF